MKAAKDAETRDRNGRPVRVGTTVRVFSIPGSVFADLSDSEIAELKSMVGAQFVVDEIDEWDNAWVTNMRAPPASIASITVAA